MQPPEPVTQESTPLPVIACVSRIVTKSVDRIAGDRVEVPLLVAAAAAEGLRLFGIEARVMYGEAAWIEVMQDHSLAWAGCWGKNFSFWTATQFGEVVDLNTSVAHRKRSHSQPELTPAFSPPILWSAEVPAFYRYKAEGIAEVELTDEADRRRFEAVLAELRQKCRPELLTDETKPSDFPNEPIVCPGRRILDDSNGNFKHFDRAIAVRGIPPAPF